jgi:hypothetical protein
MSCYICGKEKFSVEHSPPKCFFPKDKRVNLITVDSCKEHNEATSNDDEYVRNLITMLIGNNGLSYQHFLKTSIKSFSRSPSLLKITTEKQYPIIYNGSHTLAFAFDRDRIDLVMRKIAYALFYHKYQQRWCRNLITATTHLKTENMDTDKYGSLIQELQDLHTPIFEGSNPEIFQYAFMPTGTDNIHDKILRMKFYEGFEMWIIPYEKINNPTLESFY